MKNLQIQNKIHTIRNQQVMLDEDLAVLYDVTTTRLNEQVKRNIDRFPAEFCFKLSKNEYKKLKLQSNDSNLISQNAISKIL